tara:strand:- start:2079 stop:2249 length:171 start_codon:yes stop_codon:yes gene_type:complete
MNKYNECFDVLVNLVCQADQDCPVEYRTDHFTESLQDAYDFINKEGKKDPLSFWEL